MLFLNTTKDRLPVKFEDSTRRLLIEPLNLRSMDDYEMLSGYHTSGYRCPARWSRQAAAIIISNSTIAAAKLRQHPNYTINEMHEAGAHANSVICSILLQGDYGFQPDS